MVREWLIPAISFWWLVLLVWTNRVSYRHGIWDGAFNQFLPVVRREMPGVSMVQHSRHVASGDVRFSCASVAG